MISFISYKNNNLIGIIKRSISLKEGICFRFFIKEKGIESAKGYAQIFHIQQREGFAQVVFYGIDYSDIYWRTIIEKTYYNGEDYVLADHRLELIVPKFLEGISIEEMKRFIDVLNGIV